MRRNRSRRTALLAVVFGIQLFLVAPVAAADSMPLPSSMAAVGDSITQAASSAGSLGADAPQNSWATGTSTTVNSHYLRLLGAGAPISGNNFNQSVSGARMADLNVQMQGVVSLQSDYLTVLMGGNDLCTDTVAQMTEVGAFRTQFTTAMQTITQGSPDTYVYVVSVPNAYQLWELFHDSFWARLVWASAGICQSLLANPTSTQQADVQRRQQVYDRNVAYNAVLSEVCLAFTSQCRFDGNAVFNTAFAKSDVSGDYFHPSVAGQAKLASVSWTAGYSFVSTPPPNQAPTASFTSACTDLACTFTNTSSDPEGSALTSSWSFGDGATATTPDTTHTYSSAGSYTVGLTVTDAVGATGSTTQSVTVSAPVNITLTAKGYIVRGKTRVDLAWNGANGTSVDVFRNQTKITTTANDGAYTDTSRLKNGTYTYKVCQASTATCSPEAIVNF